MRRFLFCLLLSFLNSLIVSAQMQDSSYVLPSANDSVSKTELHDNTIRPSLSRQLIFPSLLTSYGFLALNNHKLRSIDNQIKEEVWVDHPHRPDHIDDALQYIPSLSVYILNGFGLHGKNTLQDANRLYLISSFAMMMVVQTTKRVTQLRRPDGFGNNTFPSGHTSTAFVAAEFLNQEYGARSPLISAAGYLMASAVGYMRIYNNRHWFRDIVSGAGIGMGVTKTIYRIYPGLKNKFWPDKKVLPAY